MQALRGHVRRLACLAMMALLLAALLPTGALAAKAEASATTMRVAATTGTVTVKNSSGQDKSILNNMQLYNGWTVETGAASYATLSLDSAKAIKLNAATKVELRQNTVTKRLELYVTKGGLVFDVGEKLADDESMNIRTANMVCGIRGTTGEVRAVSPEKTETYLLLGSTVILNTAEVLAAMAGEETPDQGTASLTNTNLSTALGDTAGYAAALTGTTPWDSRMNRVESGLLAHTLSAGQMARVTTVPDAAGVGTTGETQIMQLQKEDVGSNALQLLAEQPEMIDAVRQATDGGLDFTGLNPEQAAALRLQEQQQAAAGEQKRRDAYDSYLSANGGSPAGAKKEENGKIDVWGKSTVVDVGGGGGPTGSTMHTVTFDSNGGSEVRAQTVRDGARANRPENPERDDHFFLGWFAGDAAEAYDFTRPVTGDLVLTAHWKGIPYYIRIDPAIQHGTVTADKDEAAVREIVNLTVTPEEGYRLEELFYIDSDGEKTDIGWINERRAFEMPRIDVTVSASFVKIARLTLGIDAPDALTVTVSGTAQEPKTDDDGSAYFVIAEGAEVSLRYTREVKIEADVYALYGLTVQDANNAYVQLQDKRAQVNEIQTGEEDEEGHLQEVYTASFTMPGTDSALREKRLYRIAAEYDAEQGSLAIDATALTASWTDDVPEYYAAAGETVTLTVAPEEGMEIGGDGLGLFYYSEDDGEQVDVEFTAEGDGVYSFVMPEADVCFWADFEPISYTIDVSALTGSDRGSVACFVWDAEEKSYVERAVDGSFYAYAGEQVQLCLEGKYLEESDNDYVMYCASGVRVMNGTTALSWYTDTTPTREILSVPGDLESVAGSLATYVFEMPAGDVTVSGGFARAWEVSPEYEEYGTSAVSEAGGLQCVVDCGYYAVPGETVVLTMSPNDGYVTVPYGVRAYLFYYYGGEDSSLTEIMPVEQVDATHFRFTVPTNLDSTNLVRIDISAHFGQAHTLTLNPVSGGTLTIVRANNDETLTPGTGGATVYTGDDILLYGTPSGGRTFAPKVTYTTGGETASIDLTYKDDDGDPYYWFRMEPEREFDVTVTATFGYDLTTVGYSGAAFAGTLTMTSNGEPVTGNVFEDGKQLTLTYTSPTYGVELAIDGVYDPTADPTYTLTRAYEEASGTYTTTITFESAPAADITLTEKRMQTLTCNDANVTVNTIAGQPAANVKKEDTKYMILADEKFAVSVVEVPSYSYLLQVWYDGSQTFDNSTLKAESYTFSMRQGFDGFVNIQQIS